MPHGSILVLPRAVNGRDQHVLELLGDVVLGIVGLQDIVVRHLFLSGTGRILTGLRGLCGITCAVLGGRAVG